MLRGREVDDRRTGSPARKGNKGQQKKCIVGDGLHQQAVPKAVITANVPTRKTAAMRKRTGHHKHDDKLKRLLADKEGVASSYRHRAEKAETNLQLVTDQLAQMQLASSELQNMVKDKTDTLEVAQDRLSQKQLDLDDLEKRLKERADNLKVLKDLNEALKGKVDSHRKNIAGFYVWADEPTGAEEALEILRPGGVAAGPPRVIDIKGRWFAGALRAIHRGKMENACPCRRELAANGLVQPQHRFEDVSIIGHGGFGVVRRGRCKKTKKVYAIKNTPRGRPGTELMREMAAFAMMGPHENIIGVEALSDVAGSEGIVMELAEFNLYQACTGKTGTTFSISQLINFEADATEGLHFMHGAGIVHCDHKLQNVLICRSDGPTGFVGKMSDFGMWYGLGEMRAVKTGTVGWTTPENVNDEVAAAPDQDAFAVAVDLCYILAHPDMKNEVLSMWSHTKLMTADEIERRNVLQAEGGSLNQLLTEVTVRTMFDGSLPRIFLRPENLNPALPPAELLKACEVLGQGVSRNPKDRPNMPTMTAYLRDLAWKTATRVEGTADFPPGVGLPPAMAVPVVPAVMAPHAEGDGDGADAAVPPVEAVEAPQDPAPRGSASHGSSPPVGDPRVQAEAAEATNAAMPTLEEVSRAVSSLGRVYPAPPPIAVPHAEGETDGAGAAVPLAEADGAIIDSPLPAAAPRVAAAPTNEAIPSLEGTDECVDPLFRSLPVSPAEVLVNHMADTLRSLVGRFRMGNAHSPVAAGRFAGQPYCGGGGGGGGSRGGVGGGGGGGGDGGGGKAVVGGGSRVAEPRFPEVKGRGHFVASTCTSRAPECFFKTRFW